MVVYDQIETEPAVVYSGSYTDNVMYGEFFSTAYWSDRRTSLPLEPNIIQDAPRFVIASHVNKFKNIGPTNTGWTEEGPPPSNAAVLLANGTKINDLEFFHLIFEEKFLSRTKANSPIKFNCEEEIFADSIMPYPPDIVLANGGQFVEGAYQYESNPAELLGKEAMNRTPRRFELCLGSPAASPDGGQSYATMTSSADSSQVSDNSWCVSFPFQGKYRNILRLFTPTYAKKYYISLTQSIRPAADSTEVYTYTNSDPFESNMWTINWNYEQVVKSDSLHSTHAAVFLGVTGAIVQSWQPAFQSYIDVRYVNVNLPIFSGSDALPGVVLSPNKYPTIDSLYRNFFGFYNTPLNQPTLSGNNLFTNEYSGLYNHVGKFPYNTDFCYIKAKDWGLDVFVVSDSLEERSDALFSSKFGRLFYNADGSPPVENGATSGWIGYLRINGYKYGCYWPTPIGSTCYFRRGKFGQMRDMLEQRPYTKFYDAKSATPLAAAVVAIFSSSTQTWLTSSNPDLNTRDSGIYDFECKSGQPFADRDRE